MATEFQHNQSSNGHDHQNGDHDIDGDDQFGYLIVRPEKGGFWDLAKYTVLGDIRSGVRFLEGSDEQVLGGVAEGQRWVIVVSIIVRKIIALFGKPMEWTGYVVDFILNLLSLNGNLLGLLSNVVHGTVMVPERGTETFISTIGQLDGRINLYRGETLAEDIVGSVYSEEISMKSELGNRALMDLCIMASKLAYENAKVIREIIVDHWKMHFVEFYDCWNDFQKQMSTQVFILCDKPKDANLILVSFRGTEPFDADDWSTDFDYSWYEIPQLGKVHMGFLEAIGLGNRTNAATFYDQILVYNQLQEKQKLTPQKAFVVSGRPSEGIAALSSNGLERVPPDMVEKSAYYAVRKKLKSLLKEHKNAKFVVTGHSLGGALAILFPCVLVLHEEMELMDKLLGVYTFGQPRIGNRQLGRYMEAHLNNPVQKYFRVVYSNDLVPRLPYDNRTFLFKHFGVCLYYDSLYNEHVTTEEPNRNFLGLIFLIPSCLTAAWELLRSLTMGYTYGPEYKEGWFSILLRIIGLVLPGISAHSPTNYVNSVRLGKERRLDQSYQ
ncbi:triacylglycerol lipase OBL1-like [Argentina anserina]|uniref:triacylglycerol lipase OBL1-like n=1 Tax=Argentina anserina TaxID=57926 RepID=UPI0021766606|nr:triacylglycerol lipase OBL1-like [Potentilla anserina]